MGGAASTAAFELRLMVVADVETLFAAFRNADAVRTGETDEEEVEVADNGNCDLAANVDALVASRMGLAGGTTTD